MSGLFLHTQQVASNCLGITSTNILDAAGRVLHTTRIGTDASQIRLSSATYGTDGSLATETNALDGVTFYARGTNASGQTVLTNTAPDGGARIETLYQDGSLLSVTGSAQTFFASSIPTRHTSSANS